MVRDDAVQILRDAIAKHQAVFREYWDSGLWAKADEHWKHLLILRISKVLKSADFNLKKDTNHDSKIMNHES